MMMWTSPTFVIPPEGLHIMKDLKTADIRSPK